MELATITLPRFGAYITGQGGHFAAIMRGPADKPYALLVCDKVHELAGCKWGEYGKEISGAASRTDGHANTVAMLAADCPAAQGATQIEVDGHRDFFLPALDQLNAAAANVPELFEADGVYWTSTQFSRGSAFAQDFEYGGGGWGSKHGEFRVRAFRTIPLDLLNA